MKMNKTDKMAWHSAGKDWTKLSNNPWSMLLHSSLRIIRSFPTQRSRQIRKAKAYEELTGQSILSILCAKNYSQFVIQAIIFWTVEKPTSHFQKC